MEWSAAIAAATALALAAGGLTKGIVGIGLPLIAVPLLTLILDARTAVILMPVPILVTNVWQVAASPHRREAIARFWPLMMMVPVGTVIGAFVLKNGDPKLLALILGSFVVLAALAMQRQMQWALSARLGGKLAPGVGLLSGLIGGVSSFYGPVLIIFLAALRLPKEQFVASICWIYLIAGLSMITVFAGLDVFRPTELALSAAATVPALAGQWIGAGIRHRVPEAPFRRVVLVIVVIAGLNLIRRGLG